MFMADMLPDKLVFIVCAVLLVALLSGFFYIIEKVLKNMGEEDE